MQLIGDGAPQFDSIFKDRGLCWVHEERHYSKIDAVFSKNQELVEEVRTAIWKYYEKLKKYKQHPSKSKKEILSKEFDEIFSRTTGFEVLDKRLELTLNKKDALLLVLDYPEIPLHNNLSESGLRELVLKRKISGGTKNLDGSITLENMMTILQTCKKQGVNFYRYILDLLSLNKNMDKLKDLILT